MTCSELKQYCEKIIEPYKESLSSEALAEINSICESYCNYCLEFDTDAGYTDEELEQINVRQGFELHEMIGFVLEENGLLVYDNEEDYEEDDTI